MNILFVSNSPFNPILGGLERVTDVLTKELVRRGYTIYHLCGKLPVSKLYLLDYEYPCKLYQLPNFGLFENEENIDFYKHIQKDLGIDVVVNQRGLGGWFNDILTVTHKKLISVIHSVPEGDVMLYLSNLIESTVPPFLLVKRILKRLFLPLISIYWRNIKLKETQLKYNDMVCFSDAIVMLSQNDIEEFNRITNYSHNEKVLSIPNPNTFESVLNQNTDKEKIILYVGRLSKGEKEPIRLLKIWEKLHKIHPDWRLVVVGEGDEKQRMEEYVQNKHLLNVYFEGRQSNVSQYYLKSSFVCLTSNFEGWGMALTEGMQYGCIPLTFNNYGAAYEIIDDGINGCLIPAYNLKMYASRLSELMNDENKRVSMSNAAVEKVKKFSVEKIADKWEKLFTSI